MSNKEDILTQREISLFEELGLATFQDGFFIGTFIAIFLRLGIIQIVSPLERLLTFTLLMLGIAVTVNKAFRRKSLTSSPPWDGFISGFGVVFGVINLIETYILPLFVSWQISLQYRLIGIFISFVLQQVFRGRFK
jgi:hypothetical protein